MKKNEVRSSLLLEDGTYNTVHITEVHAVQQSRGIRCPSQIHTLHTSTGSQTHMNPQTRLPRSEKKRPYLTRATACWSTPTSLREGAVDERVPGAVLALERVDNLGARRGGDGRRCFCGRYILGEGGQRVCAGARAADLSGVCVCCIGDVGALTERRVGVGMRSRVGHGRRMRRWRWGRG